MTLYLLLPFLIILCPSLVANFVDSNAVHSIEPRADLGTSDYIRVNFTLRRRQGIEDDFCNDGVDIPGNITLEVFYRVRDGASVVGNWKSLQTKVDIGMYQLYILGPRCLSSCCMHVYYTQGLIGDLP